MIYLFTVVLSAEFWIGFVLGVFVLNRGQVVGAIKWVWNNTVGRLVP